MYENNYNNSGYPAENLYTSDVRVLTTIGDPDNVISREQAKLYLRVTNTKEDVSIDRQVVNAILQAEQFLNSDILSRTREQNVFNADKPFNLYYGPIESIESVTVDGIEQVLGRGYKTINGEDTIIRIINQPASEVVVQYTTKGIQDQSIVQGVLMLLEELYSKGGTKTNWKEHLAPFKIYGYYGSR